MGNLGGATQGDLALAAVLCGVGPTFSSNRGFSAVVRTGLGDYLMTLDNAQNLVSAALVLIQPRHAAFCAATFVATSTTQIQVLLWDAAGAAMDPTGFHIRITPLSPA